MFCMRVYRKRKAGKRLSQFDGDDWKELGIDTAGASAKGSIRGAVVYRMSNFNATAGVLTEVGRLTLIPDALLITTKTGRQNTATNMEHRMKVIFHNAGLDSYSGLHLFRRTFSMAANGREILYENI